MPLARMDRVAGAAKACMDRDVRPYTHNREKGLAPVASVAEYTA
jgi:hypothetical protein